MAARQNRVDFEEVIQAEELPLEDYKNSIKALAVGYLRDALNDPVMREKSPEELASSSMTAALTTGALLRNGYLLAEGEIDEERAAQTIATTVSTAVAIVPEGVKLMEGVVPGAHAIGTALEPICESLMPKIKEKILPSIRTVVRHVKVFAQRALCAVASFAQKVFNGFCSLFA